MEKEKPILERWHGAHHYSNKVHILLLFFLFFSAGLLLWSYFEINGLSTKIAEKQTLTTPTPSPTQQVACPMIARVCPDGVTAVGETGPNCAFQACPGEHCGGNIKDPKTCATGYHCELSISNPDTGGTCVAD